MSRSFKHAIHWNVTCYRSNKLARSYANRALRRIVKVSLNRNGEDTEILPILREVYNVYSFPSDGLGFYSPTIPKWIFESNFRKESPIRHFYKLIGK